MASDSSPPNFNNGPSSPDDSISSPIGNTLSSPGDAARHRGIRRSSTPSAFATPPWVLISHLVKALRMQCRGCIIGLG
ncbi:hypothetical protein K1719_004878 [Acacia pycnantha]|nr:hypothetical protein K1719_004878 [Acacia pycnantha]